jgi:hypothetical protein
MAELLEDKAGIFVGETAEAFADMQFAVRSGRVRLADAQAAMVAAMLTIKHALELKRRSNGKRH